MDSLRMRRVQDPIIPQVGAWINEHPGTISLGQGVVHYGPPPEIQESIQQFWAGSRSHLYGSVDGLPALREAIGAKLREDNNIALSETERVFVTAGANMGFLNALFAITEPGDEVILFVPYYFNHEMAITMVGCKAVLVSLNAQNQIDMERLEYAITKKTKAIVTVSPNNPTGAVYPRETLTAVNGLCAERGIYHISDEAYEYFVYDGVEHFSPASLPEAKEHTIALYSLSKSYGFAGWRIGYMVIPGHLAGAVAKVQDTNVICPTIITQHAAIGALQAGSAYPTRFLPGLQRVRDMVMHQLATLGDFVSIPESSGAFYAMLQVHTDTPPLDVVQYLIASHRVAVIPGTAFGYDSGCYLRVAFGALEETTVAEGIGRLAEGLRALKHNAA